MEIYHYDRRVSTGIKSVVIIFCICFTMNAQAEYYIVYSTPKAVSCEFCFKQKAKIHTKKVSHRHHPSCSHMKAAPPMKTVTHVVKKPTYHAHATKTKSPRHYHVPSLMQGEYNLDLTTGDDNPYVDPDMNIDR